MDALEFVARSEWPIVVLTAIWILRQPFREMMGRINLTKVNAWGFQADFEKTLEKVEALTPLTGKIPESMKRIELSAEPPSPKLFIQSSANPEMMVLLAWRRLEVALRRGTTHTTERLHVIATKLGISADEAIQIQELNRLRNQVAHASTPSITWDEARRFHQATEHLLGRILELQKRRSDKQPSDD